jgi:hypothetical protein
MAWIRRGGSNSIVRRSVEHGAVLDNSCRYPQMMADWFINIACTRWVPQRRLNQFVPEIVTISPAATNGIGHEGTAAHIPSDLILVRRARPGAYFICHHGGSHAAWPKDSHEHTPTQTCGLICCRPKAVDTECGPNPVERASKRPKKLRAISGASPGGSPVRKCRRGGELLPTRRALFQNDVFEPTGDIERFGPTLVRCKRTTDTC